MARPYGWYWCDALTGGAAGALDALDGDNMVDGESRAVVITSARVYYYIYNSATEAENSPSIIDCDTGAGHWVLVREYATDAEAVTGTSDDVAVTPGNLTARLAAPGAIGGTTPGAGTFTSITDGTGTITGGALNGFTSIDATTESTIEAAIDTLANLTSIQGQAVTLSGGLTVESASVVNQDLTTDADVEFNFVSTGKDEGNKIAVYDDGTSLTGFGLGTSQLQIGAYGPTATQHIAFGHFSSNGTFVEQLRMQSLTGNFGLGQSTFGTNGYKIFAIGSGTAPSTSPADAAQIWVEDAAAGQAILKARNETAESNGVVGIIETKTTTGDPAAGWEGRICINTFDNNIKIYGDAGWRTVVSW